MPGSPTSSHTSSRSARRRLIQAASTSAISDRSPKAPSRGSSASASSCCSSGESAPMTEPRRLVFVGAVAALAGACAYLPAGATTQAERLHADWSIFFSAGIAVAAIVVALILFSLVVWRRREGDAHPPQFHDNPTLEIACTIVPL